MPEINFEKFKRLVKNNRSCRKFKQNKNFSRKELENLVNLARITPSAANRQPLKYFLSWKSETNSKIFSTLSWAGALEDWEGPEEGKKPAGFIVMLGDTEITEKFFCDPGIAAQTIMLGARAKNRAGCIFAAINKNDLRENLNIDERYKILYVIALGTPAEEIVLEKMNGDDYNYWRDNDKVHHVPKRDLEEIIIN